jgi:putative phage-type endonuclease
MEQRSDEWFKARLGKVTASNLANVTASTKSGESAYRRNYRHQLVTERLTGKQTEIYVNQAMQHGIDTEDEARDFYVFKYNDVEEVGFINHPTIDMAGASPDGLVGDDGLIEIKCRQPQNHTETLISNQIPSRYRLQMFWQMACTGRKWCDYVSYCPSFPEELKMVVIRLEWNDEQIKLLEDEVIKFLTEVEDTVKFIKENNNG